jgi:hypothetical protein
VQEELPLKPINRSIIWREKKKESKERRKECSRTKKKRGGSQKRRNTNSPLYKQEIMLSSIFRSSCSIDMQG